MKRFPQRPRQADQPPSETVVVRVDSDNAPTYHVSSVMLMVQSVMMMMMSLLLGVMLGMMLAAPVRRISMVDHVDAVAGRLASPDLGDAALGASRLLAALMMILMARQAGRTVARRLSRRRLGCWLFVARRLLQGQLALVVDVDGEGDAMMRHQLHSGADRRHRGGRIEFHQGGLQLQGVHPRESASSRGSRLPISKPG